MNSEQLEQFEESVSVTSTSLTKLKKIECARQFAKTLGESNLKFIGISGSVSYEPMEEDDVDIFIITENGKLWQTLMRAFLLRRFSRLSDICISLCMEQDFAENYFRHMSETLIIEDSLHVIPLYGSDFYLSLKENITSIRNNIHNVDNKNTEREHHFSFSKIISLIAFVPLGTFLFLKGAIENFRFLKYGLKDRSFSTVIGLDRFYLDSVKYHSLRTGHEGSQE